MNEADRIVKSEEEWSQCLTPEQFRIARQKGTEAAFTGEYLNTKTPGVYTCAACGQVLFSSDAKFDSGTGWPSFWQPVDSQTIRLEVDKSHGMIRTEVSCGRCGAHLGHVFDDGPKPTGKRFCINSVVLRLAPRAEKP